jgi:hypothetical protein
VLGTGSQAAAEQVLRWMTEKQPPGTANAASLRPTSLTPTANRTADSNRQ